MTGRIPAQYSPVLGQSEAISGSHKQANVNSMHDNSACQQVPYTFGNKSGHFPASLRAANIPNHHKKRPPLLEQAKKNLMTSYFDPLAFEIGRIFYHNNITLKNGGYRKRRSEMREALTGRVGVVLAHTVNLKKWAVGEIRGKGNFIPYTMEKIAIMAGVTIWQCKRALTVYADYGYIKIETRRYLDERDGVWKTETPLILVSPDFLLHLGITEEAIREKQIKQHDEEMESYRHYQSSSYNAQQRKNKKAKKIAMKQIYDKLDSENFESTAHRGVDHTKPSSVSDILKSIYKPPNTS